jgi:hypothetical protein
MTIWLVTIITLLTACSTNITLPPTINQDETNHQVAEATPTTIPRFIAIPADIFKMSGDIDLFPPILHSDEFHEPVPVPGLINTAGGEDSPFITPDGRQLYFWFTPDVSVTPQEQLEDGATGIYVSKLYNINWTEPQRVLLNDTGQLALDGCPTIHEDTLWFCSARAGNERSIDFWTAEITPDGYTNIQNAGSELNMDLEIGEMHVSADGYSIFFHSPQEGNTECYDIWVTNYVDGHWGAPENLDSVNTKKSEGWPFISEDMQELWFLRYYTGTPALFRSLWDGEDWGEPELIISQFAGEPTLDSAGNLYFAHHFYINGVMVDADIYVAYRK